MRNMGYFSDAAIVNVDTRELDELANRLKKWMAKSPAYSGRSKSTKTFDGELNRIVRQASGPVKEAIRSAAPRKTGALADGIILHKERSRYAGKVVYDVYMDPKKNGIFQKPIMQPVRSKVPYAYYPASQEYGFFTRRSDGGMTYTRPDGSTANMSHVPGKHFMRSGVEVAGETAKNEIAGSVLSEIEQAFGG